MRLPYPLCLLALGLLALGAGCTSLESNLILAASKGEIKDVKTILAQGANINAKDEGLGTTALIIAARNGHTHVVRALLKENAEVNAVDDELGFTALMYATREGLTEMTRILLDNNADVNITTKRGMTALGIAVINGRSTIRKQLQEAGARE